jgi:phosphotransferase system HPr (HPr) family protein
MYARNAVVKSDETNALRPASRFVETAKKFESHITIINKNEVINAKSFRALCASALGKGSKIVLSAEGPDEQEAINVLCKLIEEAN